MANETTTQAPAASESPAASEGSQSQVGSSSEAENQHSDETLMDDASYAEMEAALDRAATEPKKEKQKPTPSPAAEEEDEQDAEEESDEDEQDGQESPEESEEQPESEEEEQKPLPKNFRLSTKDPQRAKFIQLLRKNPDADPIALAQKAGYRLPAAERAQLEQQQEQAEHEEAAADDPLKGLRDELADLKAKKKEARAAYEFDKVDELNDEILEKALALKDQEREIAEQTEYQREFRSSMQEARHQAVTQFPDTAKAGTAQFRLVQMAISDKQRSDPQFLQDPSYPIRIVQELQEQFPDIFRGAAVETPAAKPKVPARLPARPALGSQVSGNKGTNRPASREEAIQEIDGITNMQELEELANQVGTPTGKSKPKKF